MIVVLMMSANLDTPRHFKMKAFWSTRSDVISSFYDAIKFFSRDSNHIVDIIIWPMFEVGISMREVIITLIL